MIEVAPMEQEEAKYISIEEARLELGVNRGSIDYILRSMNIERKKFELDKKKYILISDFERIKTAREAAKRGRH